MKTKLKLNHRHRIELLKEKSKFSSLDQYLEKISGRGFDVASVPFRLMDDVFSSGAEVAFEEIIPLTRHTVGAQPRLLTAVLNDLCHDTQEDLR